MTYEQIANEELHYKTWIALCRASTGICRDEDMEVLCYHCGIGYEDIKSEVNALRNTVKKLEAA